MNNQSPIIKNVLQNLESVTNQLEAIRNKNNKQIKCWLIPCWMLDFLTELLASFFLDITDFFYHALSLFCFILTRAKFLRIQANQSLLAINFSRLFYNWSATFTRRIKGLRRSICKHFQIFGYVVACQKFFCWLILFKQNFPTKIRLVLLMHSLHWLNFTQDC